LWLSYGPWRFERAKEEIRNRYPSVARLDAPSLKEWFDRREGPKPVVIDVRPRAEYEFSHLPGAKHMAPSDTPAALGFAGKDDAPFVICDAVGADASAVAASLGQLGYKHVQVLDGGIFEWANKALPIEGSNGPAGKVASGSSRYASLLKRSRRAP
jgi:rhodanese-related sulfurtransferase